MATTGEGWQGRIVRVFVIDRQTLLYLKWITTRTYYTECRTLLHVMRQPGWEVSMRKNACLLNCFSYVWLIATPWTVAHQAPLSIGCSRQEYWGRSPFPSPGDLPDPGIKPTSLASWILAGEFFNPSATWEAHKVGVFMHKGYGYFLNCYKVYTWRSLPVSHSKCAELETVVLNPICTLVLLRKFKICVHTHIYIYISYLGPTLDQWYQKEISISLLSIEISPRSP